MKKKDIQDSKKMKEVLNTLSSKEAQKIRGGNAEELSSKSINIGVKINF